MERGDSDSFREQVYDIVRSIPKGRVMTYGDIAALSGHPRAARQVGGLAHFGPASLPWHRVVNRNGECASGYHGGKLAHQEMLVAEGVEVADFRVVNFAERRWRPDV